MKGLSHAVLSAALLAAAEALACTPLQRRRQWLAGMLVAAPLPGLAFPNASPEAARYADRPKRRGPQPTDLGLAPRVLNQYGDLSEGPALKACKGPPNCFSTTGDPELDADALLTPWVPPRGMPDTEAARVLEAALRSYPPGQAGIDGAGFVVVVSPEATRETYLYAQFESLRQGYIDDVEFAVRGGQALVRSSSRVGYLDFAVNATRLNWIAKALRAQGWTAPDITPATHPGYFAENNSKG